MNPGMFFHGLAPFYPCGRDVATRLEHKQPRGTRELVLRLGAENDHFFVLMCARRGGQLPRLHISPRPPVCCQPDPLPPRTTGTRIPGMLRLIPSWPSPATPGGFSRKPRVEAGGQPRSTHACPLRVTAWNASRRAQTAAARLPRPGTSRGSPCAAAPWWRAVLHPCPAGCAVCKTRFRLRPQRQAGGSDWGFVRMWGQAPVGVLPCASGL